MKKSSTLVGLVVLTVFTVALVVVIGSCTKTGNTPSGNHTIDINNSGSNNTICNPKQFTSLTLTPVDGSSAAVTYNFVSNPLAGDVLLKVNIAANKVYKIVVFAANGKSIWWNSVAMAVNGNTNIGLYTNTNGYSDNSYCNSIHCDGTNITCSN
ncbi:MAG: hypothetical protein Q8908_15735 [Bacteroidota bacterium]|nr:hypothetical protein [Bacteroidota bacterium]